MEAIPLKFRIIEHLSKATLVLFHIYSMKSSFDFIKSTIIYGCKMLANGQKHVFDLLPYIPVNSYGHVGAM